MTTRVSFFIDGFNFYHSLKGTRYEKFLWMNYQAFVNNFVQAHRNETCGDVFYFSAIVTWDHEAASRHKKYITALKEEGVKVILGKFKRKDKVCRNCNYTIRGNEEKMTDVNLALQILSEAHNDTFDKAFIVSADSDMVPAIKAVKGAFPTKKVGVIFPINRNSTELQDASDIYLSTRKYALQKSQFLPEITALIKASHTEAN